MMWLTGVLTNQWRCSSTKEKQWLPVRLTGAVADGTLLTERSRSQRVVTYTLATHTLSPVAANQPIVWHTGLCGDGTGAGLTRPARETDTLPRNTPSVPWTEDNKKHAFVSKYIPVEMCPFQRFFFCYLKQYKCFMINKIR